MLYNDEIKQYLTKSNSENLLRNYCLKLYSEDELVSKEIYSIFYDCRQSIIGDINEEMNVAILEDVMDMIVGCYAGKNIDFENENYDKSLILK